MLVYTSSPKYIYIYIYIYILLICNLKQNYQSTVKESATTTSPKRQKCVVVLLGKIGHEMMHPIGNINSMYEGNDQNF